MILRDVKLINITLDTPVCNVLVPSCSCHENAGNFLVGPIIKQANHHKLNDLTSIDDHEPISQMYFVLFERIL